MLSSTFSDCCRVTQTPGKGPLESVCRHYKTCSLDQSLKCLPLKRTREVMIRLLDWYHLTRNAKQLNWPKSVYLHKLVLVNVSSAIVIVAGFLPSTSPTDAQSINTGSGSGIILISMPWAILAVLLLRAGAPAPIRLFLLGKARELSPLPFLTQMLIEGDRPHHRLRCHQSLQLYQVSLVSLTVTPGPEYAIPHCKAYLLHPSPLKYVPRKDGSLEH